MSTQRNLPAIPRRLLRLAEVKHHVGLGRSAIYDQIKRGDFPAPVHVGPRAVAWASDQISAWIDSRIESGRVSATLRRDA
jgi:prophage regulatory protein